MPYNENEVPRSKGISALVMMTILALAIGIAVITKTGNI